MIVAPAPVVPPPVTQPPPVRPPAPRPPAPPVAPPAPAAAAGAEVWDGHRMRKCDAGHVHKGGCGHYLVNGRWSLYQSEPREIAERPDDKARARPGAGLYDYKGKTYYLGGHTHGEKGCVHKFKLDHWVLED